MMKQDLRIYRAHISGTFQRLFQAHGLHIRINEEWNADRFVCTTRKWVFDKFIPALRSATEILECNQVEEEAYRCGHFATFAAWYANHLHILTQRREPDPEHPELKEAALAVGVCKYGELLTGGLPAHAIIAFILKTQQEPLELDILFFDPYPTVFSVVDIGKDQLVTWRSNSF